MSSTLLRWQAWYREEQLNYVHLEDLEAELEACGLTPNALSPFSSSGHISWQPASLELPPQTLILCPEFPDAVFQSFLLFPFQPHRI